MWSSYEVALGLCPGVGEQLGDALGRMRRDSGERIGEIPE